MLLPAQKIVDADAAISLPPPQQQILWPTASGFGDNGGSDSGVFPSLTAIKARHAASPPEALTAFVEAVRLAQVRILVVDDFLFKPKEGSRQHRYDQILSWLPNGLIANEIRFLTNEHEDDVERLGIQKQFSERVAAINQSSPRRAGTAKIEIKFSLGTQFPYIHDRFAVVDNELWHFGATVGGLHRLVNAATRGWNAEAHDAIRFFYRAWDGDNDKQYGGCHG